MYNIKTLNKISPNGLDVFDRNKYRIGDDVEDPNGILVRSAAMHEMELPESLLAVARAGAGVNNIPIDRCSEQGRSCAGTTFSTPTFIPSGTSTAPTPSAPGASASRAGSSAR